MGVWGQEQHIRRSTHSARRSKERKFDRGLVGGVCRRQDCMEGRRRWTARSAGNCESAHMMHLQHGALI